MDTTKHLLTVMCTAVGGGDHHQMTGDLRLGFGSVVQQVEKASAYLFAEVPPAHEVLRATGVWQKAFLMEVLIGERCLVVDRTLYCGFKPLSQDRFTYFFDADSDSLRQLYVQYAHAAAASAFPHGTGASSGIPFPFSLGMALPALSTLSSSPSVSSPSAVVNGHSLPRGGSSIPMSTTNGSLPSGVRRAGSIPASSSPAPTAMVTVDRNNGTSCNGNGDDAHRHHHHHHHHYRHPAAASGGGGVKEEEEEDTDDFYTFGKAVNLAGDDVSNASEEECFEQPPAKLFLLTEYCYFDPTVLKKRSIRCIPCKMSLSKMGWKQHMLSTFHLDKKAKFNARGQTPQQSGELVYRSARGVLTCLACAVLLPPQDFDKHVGGPMHTKKRREWAMLDHIERWSDILSKKPRYSTATPLSPAPPPPAASSTSSSRNTSSSSGGNNATLVLANAAAAHPGVAACDQPRASALGPLSPVVGGGAGDRPSVAEMAPDSEGPGLGELFFVECYPMTPVTGYTQWVALHSTRNWDARNFEVLITTRGKQERLVVEPLSWKTTTQRGFLFNLAVKFERTYGPDPVPLCLVIRDPSAASAASAPASGMAGGGAEQEIQIPLGRAIVCSNSSQRLKRLQQLSEESALTETEQRVIPHYTQCALVHKGREHRYRVKPLPTIAATTTAATPVVHTPAGAIAHAAAARATSSSALMPTTATIVAAALAASAPHLSTIGRPVPLPVLSSSSPAVVTSTPSSSSSSSSSPLMHSSPMMTSPLLQRRSPPTPSFAPPSKT